MNKKRLVVIILMAVLVISIAIVFLYQTFATSITMSGDSESTYIVNLENGSTVSVPAKSSKLFIINCLILILVL